MLATNHLLSTNISTIVSYNNNHGSSAHMFRWVENPGEGYFDNFFQNSG